MYGRLNDWALQRKLDGKDGVLAQMEAEQELWRRGYEAASANVRTAKPKSL